MSSRTLRENAHLKYSGSIEKEIALEDFEDARKDVRAGGEKSDEERKKVEHLWGESSGSLEENLP